MSYPVRDEEPLTGLASFGDSAGRVYLFIGAMALLACYLLMSARAASTGDPRTVGIVLTIAVAVPGLLLRWVISPALFLIMLSYQLYDPNFANITGAWNEYRRSTMSSYPSNEALQNFLLGAAVIVYLMAQYRLLSHVLQSMPDDPPPRRKGQPEALKPRRPGKLASDRELVKMVLMAIGCTLVGSLGWLGISRLESGERLGATWGILRPFARLMLFLWAFTTVTLLTGVFFRYRALCRMTRLQARMVLQDTLWQEVRGEHERIYRWRRWFRNRQEQSTSVPRS